MIKPINRHKRVIFTTIVVVLALALLEGLLSVIWLVPDYLAFRRGLPIAEQFKEEFHSRHDAEIGWEHIPGKHIPDFCGPGLDMTVNSDGFRGLEDYVGREPQDRFRVVCLGDSFTLGFGVGDRQTYPYQLQLINAGVQAVNMGQGGYSLGQCYLWYRRQGASLQADCLVLALIIDDIRRLGEVRLINGYAKPGFQLHEGQLRITGQPVPDKTETGARIVAEGQLIGFFTEHSALVRTIGKLTGHGPYQEGVEQSELLSTAMAIVSELQRLAREQDTVFVMVLMPEMRELVRTNIGEYREVSATLRRFAAEKNIPFLDLVDTFLEAGPRLARGYFLKEHWQHYSETGNRLVARKLDAFLGENVPGYPRRPHRMEPLRIVTPPD